MTKKTASLLLFAIVLLNLNIFASTSNDGWHFRTDFLSDTEGKMLYKQDGNIKFTFYSDVKMPERAFKMKITKKYIQECISILKEGKLTDSVDIVLVRNRNDMKELIGFPIAGITHTSEDEYMKQKTILCIGGYKNPLKHEIMHLVSHCKWGDPENSIELAWLVEGLATYADPQAECDTYSFEEKYTYFLQSKKSIPSDSLINSFEKQHAKIGYNQAAYIVKYLIENYGIEKCKTLWINGMNSFEKIYDLSFKNLLKSIEVKLLEQHPHPIPFDWIEFEKKCY